MCLKPSSQFRAKAVCVGESLRNVLKTSQSVPCKGRVPSRFATLKQRIWIVFFSFLPSVFKHIPERFPYTYAVSKTAPEAPKSAPRDAKRPPRGPKVAPRLPKSAPRAAESAPRAPQEHPESGQDWPKNGQEQPKNGQERPKNAQERPRAAESAPRAP